jgi:hypothetical protein
MLSLVPLIFISPTTNAVIAEQPCNTYSWTGEDDTAHQMDLTNPLNLGDVTYDTTYVTTNGTLTFGTPDANFSSYPNTPSISLAGSDWVTFGEGTSLSYGSTNTGFCVEWKVRPFPQSTGNITTIKLTVDTSRLPSWSGIIETTGWLPADLRRGIRFAPGQDVVTISEAFTINGGVPVEMQTCWDGTIIPMSGTCPAEPPPGQCWDGSTVAYNETCPPIPPDTQCWDGTWIAWSQTCPQQPPPIECWDGSSVNWNAQCPPTPPNIICWDESVVLWNQICPVEPTPEPTLTPTPEPSESLTPEPTLEPTPSVTPEPTPTPTQTMEPTPTPEPTPTAEPTPMPDPSVDPTPEPTSIVDPTPELTEETVAPTPEETLEPTPSPEPLPSTEETDPPTTTETSEEEPISSAENIPNELSVDELMQIDLEEIVATDLTVEQLDALTEAALEVFETAEPGSEEYQQALETLFLVAQADDIILDESLAAIPLLGDILGGTTELINFLGNVGADMSPQVREQSEKIVVTAVVAVQVALSAISLSGIATTVNLRNGA